MLQENNIINIASTASAVSAASALALFSLSSQSSSTPSSPRSFTHEYDTSNCFSRLPNETIFTIFAFVITSQTTTTSEAVYSPHKQLSILSQVCRLFNKISDDVLLSLWQIAFETVFDSEAIIRAGIIDNSANNVIGDSVNAFGGAEGEGENESSKITTTQLQNPSFVQIQTDKNIWKELYKERQVPLNKVKNYVNPTLPSPFAHNGNDDDENDNISTPHLDVEPYLDEGNENDHINDIITNNGDSSTLDSTDLVDDNVSYQSFDYDFDFNFVGNEEGESRTEETGRLDFALEDDEEFRFQELDNILEDNTIFAAKNTTKEDDTVNEESLKENIMDLNVEDNLEFTGTDNISTINLDDVAQSLDFVSEDLIKFDDPELDSIFSSDTTEINKFVKDVEKCSEILMKDAEKYSEILVKDVEKYSEILVKDVEKYSEISVKDVEKCSEILVKDTDNSAKEVDHVAQAQDFSSLEINGDSNIIYLQDYGESSKLLDREESSLKLPGYEESLSELQNFDEDEPRMQDYDESSAILQNFDQDEPKLKEDLSPKSPDTTLKEATNDDLPDYDENEEEFDFGEPIDLQDFDYGQVENCSKESYKQENDNFPDHNEDEVTTNPKNKGIINDLPDYVEDEEENLLNENIINIINEKEQNDKKENDGLLDYNTRDAENNQTNYGENEIEKKNEDYDNGNDSELLKMLNVIWKICQENDGMNSEVLLGHNVKELAVSLIQSSDKTETHVEHISIALQILSILVSWHPELSIDFHKNDSFWYSINDEAFCGAGLDSSKHNPLTLSASAGSATHILFHTTLFNLTDSRDISNYVPSPQLIPNSNIFKEGIIKPSEDFNGRWCGYYMYTRITGITDSPMDVTSLKFSPPKPGKVYYLNRYVDANNSVLVADKVIKELSGSGTDQHGEFIIMHGIVTEKGNVNFIKKYIGRHSWVYDGVLLPVGICGRWGTPLRWSGNFWIWKR